MTSKAHDIGVTDAEIRIGHLAPRSGPNAVVFSQQCAAIEARFRKVNDEGGIGGRRLVLVSYDNAPPAGVTHAVINLSLVKRLVEEDRVFLIFNSVGGAPNEAIRGYLNNLGIPQIFAATVQADLGDPVRFPWSIGLNPSGVIEGGVYARHLARKRPGAKLAVLYQDDMTGTGHRTGLLGALSDGCTLAAEVSYAGREGVGLEHIERLAMSNAEVLAMFVNPAAGIEAISAATKLGWRPPIRILARPASSIQVMKRAGLEYCLGMLSVAYFKEPADPVWSADPGMLEYAAFMSRYFPDGDNADGNIVQGYIAVAALVQVLSQCGENLTRANAMAQALALRDFAPGMLLPGISINTGWADFAPIKQLRMARFDGIAWKPFGAIIDGLVGASVRVVSEIQTVPEARDDRRR